MLEYGDVDGFEGYAINEVDGEKVLIFLISSKDSPAYVKILEDSQAGKFGDILLDFRIVGNTTAFKTQRVASHYRTLSL